MLVWRKKVKRWNSKWLKGILITVTVALGVRFPNGQYLLFSNTVPAGPIWQDLLDAQASLYRGRLFYALLNDFVTPNAVLWDRCSAGSHSLFAGEEFCLAGRTLDEQYPGTSEVFLAGRQPPVGWLLLGWALGERTATNSVVWEVEKIPECEGIP